MLLPRGQGGYFHRRPEVSRYEAGLATVLAHEAPHVMCRHPGERQSQATMAHMGGLGLGLGLGRVGGV